MSEQQQEYGGIIINGIDCSGGGGSSVTPNPPAPATETLSSLDINGVVYGIEQETRENIFSIFDTFNKNQKYADDSSFTPDESFFFKIEDDDSSWSSTATIYNNNAYNLTNIDKLELVVEITQQTDYAYFWVTFSQTKYTWNSTTWPGLYDNVDSTLQITQSGSYEIDVSSLTGSYYIYIGATTGKDSTTHGGGCNNTHNGHITGTVTEFNIISTSSGTKVIPNPSGSATDTLEKLQIENTIYDFDAGTEVIANPTETATDTLNTISIDGTIYEIEGGGSGGGSSAFIDTSNKLQTIQVTSGDDWSYVATQDCWATINPWNSSNSTPSQIYLDNVELVAIYNSRPQYAIYIKQGQTLLIKARTDYTYGSIYGLLQGGSGGSIILKEGEYANFTNAGYIALPFTLNSDYILEVDYEATVNRNNNSVIGLSNGSTGLIHLTQWNNQWAHGTGTEETFYSDAQGMTSRHIYQCNYNGHNYLDNTEMSTYTPSSDSTVYYHIGSRGTGNLYTGKIYSYKLTSISTGDVITHLKPMKLMAGKVILKEGLYDLVNDKFYSCNGMTIVGEGGGSTVIGTYIEPNSEEESTETLENIKIDDTVYSIGGGNFYKKTTAEYQALPLSDKEDPDKLYFIDNSGEQITELDNTNWVNSTEANMSISIINNKLTYAWSGGTEIGANSVYSVAIPASVNKIRFSITTGTSYYNTYDPTIERFKVFIGVRLTYTTGFIYPPNLSDWLALKDFNTDNSVWEDELDLSNVSEDSYLYISGHGWNMTIDSLQLITESGDTTNNCIYYQNIKYADNTGGEIPEIPIYKHYLKNGNYEDEIGGDTYTLTNQAQTTYNQIADSYIQFTSTSSTYNCLTFASSETIPKTMKKLIVEYVIEGIQSGENDGFIIGLRANNSDWVGYYGSYPAYGVTSWDDVIKTTGSGIYELDLTAYNLNETNMYFVIGSNGVSAKITNIYFDTGETQKEIEPNPEGESTDNLKKIRIEDVIYQITSCEEKTTAAYYDIPEETRNTDNVLYAITDDGIHLGDTYAPVIYSTEEREIGVWTDGKPLYQKTYVIDNPSTSPLIIETINNLDTMVNFQGSFYRTSKWYEIDGRTETSSYNNYGCNWGIESNQIQISFQGYSISEITKIRITVRYTKTTDVAGSGSYNTLGVPTVHYTTDEQVIGTWIDGKPLYRKTVIKSGTISQRETVSLGIANVENIFLVSDASNVNNGQSPLPLVTGTDNNNNTGGFFDIQQSDTSFLFRIGSGMVGYVENAIITVQYTKTTD